MVKVNHCIDYRNKRLKSFILLRPTRMMMLINYSSIRIPRFYPTVLDWLIHVFSSVTNRWAFYVDQQHNNYNRQTVKVPLSFGEKCRTRQQTADLLDKYPPQMNENSPTHRQYFKHSLVTSSAQDKIICSASRSVNTDFLTTWYGASSRLFTTRWSRRSNRRNVALVTNRPINNHFLSFWTLPDWDWTLQQHWRPPRGLPQIQTLRIASELRQNPDPCHHRPQIHIIIITPSRSCWTPRLCRTRVAAAQTVHPCRVCHPDGSILGATQAPAPERVTAVTSTISSRRRREWTAWRWPCSMTWPLSCARNWMATDRRFCCRPGTTTRCTGQRVTWRPLSCAVVRIKWLLARASRDPNRRSCPREDHLELDRRTWLRLLSDTMDILPVVSCLFNLWGEKRRRRWFR